MSRDLAAAYRPQNFEDVVGQDKIVSLLKDQVTTGNLSNAYIFSGPSGVGKTTLARLVYMTLNCDEEGQNPCMKCPSCQNLKYSLIEVDGASNRGIDNIRELQKKMYYKSFGNYTGILIDECHQLSKAAWNALLKSIEEPPEHVKWFFCTTELNKVPKTIQTRCQIFRLKSIRWTDIKNRVKEIAQKEKIVVSEDSLWTIAKNADNNVRQAIHLLEKYSLSGEVEDIESKNDFLKLLSEDNFKDLFKLFDSWDKHYESIEHFINTLKYDLINLIKLNNGLKIKVSPYKRKKYKEVNISDEKLEKTFESILKVEEKVKGVYDYNSLLLKALLEIKK